MDKNITRVKLDNGISVRLDFHENSRTAQYEVWVRKVRDAGEYGWKIEAKAQTLPRATRLYEEHIQALQAV
jgi:hypothetical protein